MADNQRDQLQQAARHLLQQPLTCAEHYPEIFALIRRHQQTLDRWYTQRLGYRLHVASSTARLYKSTVIPHRPQLRAPVGSKRQMSQRESTLLVLILAAVAAGPRVISLRDLIDDVRSQATDADITLSNEPIERRALIIALKWLIQNGIVKELHEHIDRYEHDDTADAILEIDPDRVGLLPLAILGRAENTEQLLDRTDRRTNTRQWMRAQLTEDPVLYKTDVSDYEWSELRRRLGEEITMLDEMFDLQLESRAEGIAAIDPDGSLTDQPFPSTGTVGHAALLFIEHLMQTPDMSCTEDQAVQIIEELAEQNQKHWSKARVQSPQTFLREVVHLLIDHRLLEKDDTHYTLLPAAARYRHNTTITSNDSVDESEDQSTPMQQDTLW